MPLSSIERLPVELLQPIFIFSGSNVALVDSSPLLAAKLSSIHVYHAVCNQYLTCVLEPRAEQARVQTLIFASKWMTWAFFKTWIVKRYEEVGCLCGRTPDEGCFDAQWPPDFEDATSMVFSRSHLPEIAFVWGRLPKKLFMGKWTADKIQFLRFLLWITGMTVDWKDPDTRTIAIEGRKRAVQERNLDAVELFNHNRRLGRVADIDYIRYAVLVAGCDRSIVHDTMFAAAMWGKKGSYECKELDRWCVDREREGNPKGLWMRSKLAELRGYHESFSDDALCPKSGDYDGGAEDKLIVRHLMWDKVSEFLSDCVRFVRRLLCF